MLLFFWPAVFLAWPSLWRAWKERTDTALRFCLAWLVPAWVLFELIPTKLPHYVLPMYPALALICARSAIAVLNGAAPWYDKRLLWVTGGLWALVGLDWCWAGPPRIFLSISGQKHPGIPGSSLALRCICWPPRPPP
jgi:4-amino-4-deoxy-L-arabinose transferase-like glycosyltransferase